MATTIATYEDVTIYRADRLDANGNPRVIVHFTNFLTNEEYDKMDVLTAYDYAVRKAKKFGSRSWRKYTCKEFGGGLICQYDYCNGYEVYQEVKKIKEQTL